MAVRATKVLPVGRRLVASGFVFTALASGLFPARAASWQDTSLDLRGGVSADSFALEGDAPRLATVTPEEEVGFASCASRCLDAGRWTVLSEGLGSAVTSVSLAAVGGQTTVAFAEAGGRVATATCATGCGEPSSWATTEIDTASAGTTVSLAAAADGTLHLAYTKNGQLRYGRFDGATWTTVELAGAGASRPALVVEGGLPRLVHVDAVEGGERLRYLACAAAPCAAADWSGAAVTPATGSLGRPSLAASGTVARVAVESAGDAGRTLQWLQCDKGCTDGGAWSAPASLTEGGAALAPSVVLGGSGSRARLAFVACRDCGTVLESRTAVVGTCEAACEQRASWSFTEVGSAPRSQGVSLRRTSTGGLRLAYGTAGPVHFACDGGCGAGTGTATTTTTAAPAPGDGGDDGGEPRVLDSDQTNSGGRRLRAPSFTDNGDDRQRRPRVAVDVDGDVAAGGDAAAPGAPVPLEGRSSGGSDVPPVVGMTAALMLLGSAWLVPRAARAREAAMAPLAARLVD